MKQPIPTLDCTNIGKSFDGWRVFDQVNLIAHAGQLVAILGPSGCGKTTLLRLIAGFEWPDTGTISINGQIVSGHHRRIPPEERRVGMVFQEYALFHHLDVADNIAFGLRSPAMEKRQRIAEMLTLVGLEGLENRMPHELSGGQQQRVALARALAPRPDILLLDEPFSNLDAALRIQIRREVRSILKNASTTCLFVTHDQEEALSFADRVAVLLDGYIAQFATPQVLYQQPVSRAVATFVGEANFLPGQSDGNTVTCALGRLPIREATLTPQKSINGSVDVLIRPEMIRFDQDRNGISAYIVWGEFYGHTQRLGLRLQDGTSLIARLDSHIALAAGEEVSIQVPFPVLVFPMDNH